MCMKRDVNRLEGHTFDLLVIGGGIYGAAVARQAALQGLSVALVEKLDFGHATSSNSLKIIHGGLRYLQGADIKRMRRSIVARRTLLKIAPHHVKPLRFVLPTFGKFLKGRPALFAAMFLNDLISWDRNILVGKKHRIPRGAVLTKSELIELVPGMTLNGCTGGAVWYDAVASNTERLTLEFVRSAVEQGASAANYVEVTELTVENETVCGVVSLDHLTGRSLKIRAKFIINTSGPWTERVTSSGSPLTSTGRLKWAKAVNVYIRKRLFDDIAVGFYGSGGFCSRRARGASDSRVFFCVPWGNGTMIGTGYQAVSNPQEDLHVTDTDTGDLLEKFNANWPDVGLCPDDIGFCHLGLVPVVGRSPSRRGGYRLRNRSVFIDHYKRDGLRGLVSLAGVKYTTAVIEARDLVAEICKITGHATLKKKMEKVLPGAKFHGGNDPFDFNGSKNINECSNPGLTGRLFHDYGAISRNILSMAAGKPGMLQPVDDRSNLTAAEVVYFVREEMARKIADVLFRRTNIGWFGYPGSGFIEKCADIIGEELGWDSKRKSAEVDDAKRFFEDLQCRQQLR